MFKSYLKTSIRFLLKNKVYGFVNIIGLAIGTLCCLYILLYVEFQYSYDKQHNNAKDIYRVTTQLAVSGDKYNFATASPPIGPALKNDFNEVSQYTRAIATSNRGVKEHLLKYKDKSIYEENAIFADSTFFDVFTYHFIRGNARGALDDPYSIVLLKSTADKLFAEEDPMNKLIEIDNDYGKDFFKVTGVVEELGKSHINGRMFISMNSGGVGKYVLAKNDWAGNNFVATYVKLNPHAVASALENRLPGFLNKYGQQQLKAFGMEKRLHLQPVGSIHTSEGYENEMTKTVSTSFLDILILIAVFIQVIACINFMNLATARASKRAKEVGIRKVAGAGRTSLIKQFLGESFFLAFIGVLIALPLLWLCLPYLNEITKADIRFSFLFNYKILLLLVTLILVTGLLAGSYPAFYLSAFQVIKVMKGDFANHITASGLRKSLVVFQFVLSVILISSIVVIYSQMIYIRNKDLGFSKDQQIVFSFRTNNEKERVVSFINDLKKLPEIKAVSKSNNYPSQFVASDWPFYLAGGNMATSQDAQFMLTDENFIKTMGIKLTTGRDFRINDTDKILINETMAKKLGLNPETAIGTRIYTKQEKPDPLVFEIIGVMKDFNYNSLHESVKPFSLMYTHNMADFSYVMIDADSKDYKSLLEKIGFSWRHDIPSVPMEYVFLDDEVQKEYEAETTFSQIINSFTFIAVFISCLGLFGLAAFSAEQRNKEIGIRKVLGASTSSIVKLLSADFLKLVTIAIVVSIPISWWVMDKWLQGFAYRISISWWMFAVAGLLAVFIALFTVSSQAMRAAATNPVKSLKSV